VPTAALAALEDRGEDSSVTEGHDFTEEYWESHYREPEHDAHPSTPNPHLLAVAAGLRPGTALDAGCGEGADAIRLAQLGWTVTGVDISATAVDKAKDAAAASGLTNAVEFRCSDITSGVPEPTFDLVTAHHVHTPDDRAFVRALGAAVRPGGLLLVVGHEPPGEHDVDLHSPGSHATAGQVASYLAGDEWDVMVAEVRARSATSPDGEPCEDKDSVFLARRRSSE
jgi:SAM-dependent methyltransferase